MTSTEQSIRHPSVCRVQQSFPPVAPTITPLQRTFNELPQAFLKIFGEALIKSIQSTVENYLINPSLGMPFQRNPQNTIHQFKYDHKIIIYVQEGLPFGNGTAKKVSTAWRLRVSNRPKRPEVSCVRVARTDINFANLVDHESASRAADTEATLHANLRHDNICALYDWQKYNLSEAKEAKKENVTMYMEFYPQALNKQLSAQGATTEHFWQLAKNMLSALDYLHTFHRMDGPDKYIHSDIKPANIVFDGAKFALIDFGLVNWKVGTLAYMPLDYIDSAVLEHSENDETKDLWALGCTLYVTYLAIIYKSISPTYLLYPPWGMILNFYDQVVNNLERLEEIQKSHPLPSEESKQPATARPEVVPLLQIADEIVKAIATLTFSNWTSILPPDFSPFAATHSLAAKFEAIANLTKDIQKTPDAYVHELPALIRPCKDMLEALTIHIKRLAQILDEIPKPTKKEELIIWHLLHSKNSFSAKQIADAFFAPNLRSKSRAAVPATAVVA